MGVIPWTVGDGVGVEETGVDSKQESEEEEAGSVLTESPGQV